MKLFSILMGVMFVFSVSQKSFACDCDKAHKGDKAPASTTVADAKDATKTDATAEKTCACGKSGKDCTCKDCGCGKHKDKNHKHDKAHKKHGKDCGCDDKKEEV